VDEQLTDIMNTLERTHQEEVTRLRERAAHFPAEDSAGDPDALDLSSLSATGMCLPQPESDLLSKSFL